LVLVEAGDQIGAAFGAMDAFLHAGKNAFDLLVEFDAVGDDQHARAGDVFADPFGQPDHRQAFAAALGVPDDAALTVAHPFLAALTPKYWLWRQSFFVPASKTMKS